MQITKISHRHTRIHESECGMKFYITADFDCDGKLVADYQLAFGSDSRNTKNFPSLSSVEEYLQKLKLCRRCRRVNETIYSICNGCYDEEVAISIACI